MATRWFDGPLEALECSDQHDLHCSGRDARQASVKLDAAAEVVNFHWRGATELVPVLSGVRTKPLEKEGRQ